MTHVQGRTEQPGCLTLSRWSGWSAGQVGRHVKWWRTVRNRGGGPEALSYREGWRYSDKLFAGASDFLVTPLLVGPVCLISQDRFKEPVRPSIRIQRNSSETTLLSWHFFLQLSVVVDAPRSQCHSYRDGCHRHALSKRRRAILVGIGSGAVSRWKVVAEWKRRSRLHANVSRGAAPNFRRRRLPKRRMTDSGHACPLVALAHSHVYCRHPSPCTASPSRRWWAAYYFEWASNYNK